MSEIKGYVVRGVGKFSDRVLFACQRFGDDYSLTEQRAEAVEHPTVARAIEAAFSAMTGCRDVTILVVQADGTEVALPSYEQALAQFAVIGAAGDALVSLMSTMATSARDWSASNDVAWLYGIVCGWDDSALPEVAARHGWHEPKIERLRTLRSGFVRALPSGEAPPPRAPDMLDMFDALPSDDRGRIKDEAIAARDAVRKAGGTKEAAKAAWDEAIRKGVAEFEEEAAS